MSDFTLNYKNAIEAIPIPELSEQMLISTKQQKIRVKRLRRYRIISLSLICLILGGLSSAGVYAYELYQRTVYRTDNEVLIPASENLYSKGAVGHNYEANGSSYPSQTQEASDELLHFTSWKAAEEYLPFSVVYPDIDYPVSIVVQPGFQLVEAVYERDNSVFSITYNYYANDNWDVVMSYNGEITGQSSYVNSYGYVFSETSVLLDETTYLYETIAFKNYLIQLQFENMDMSAIYEILDKLNLEIYQEAKEDS